MRTATTTPQPRQRTAPHPSRGRFVLLAFVWRLVLAFVNLFMLGALVAAVAVGWLYYRYGSDLPAPEQISQYRSFETTRIYANDGQTLLYELVGPQAGRRTVVAFDKIPRMLQDATVAVEDAGFYNNPGVDLRGIVRALWLNYQNQEVVSGGSTITQQLVRNILLPPEERQEMSYERKLREAILAYRVSQTYSKEQILNTYLNEVYYGAQSYGVEAAAQSYFGKHVWELSDGEATLIAGLPQSPTVLNPFTNLEGARARQKITLDLMVRSGYLTAQQADAIYAEPLTLVPQETNLQAPHFAFYVRDLLEQRYGPDMLYRAGLRVTTSIDLHWQAETQRIAQQHIAELRDRNATNAAVVMLAPDGRILAMVGSVDYAAPDGQVNVALAPRQPGSALKPFVYAAAMQHGWTPATIVWDEPTDFANGDASVYEPSNYDNSWHGPMRLRMALANSLNIPAVKALEHAGVDNFVELMTRFGITTFNDPSRYGLAMALGSNEVRLLELSGAYNALDNGGRYVPPTAILDVTNSRGEVLERWTPPQGTQVLGPQGEQLAYLVTNMLSDNQARWYMFGRDNVMELPDGISAAVKTGTSNDWRDSWTVGYTSNVTVGVWVGNNDNSPMDEVAGSNGAGVIWRDVMLAYHAEHPAEPFKRPDGVVEQMVCADTGGLAGEACPRPIPEQFVADNVPSNVDVTYQIVKVGSDGSCLASASTPPDQARDATYAVYPPEFREWAARSVPQPPTQPCAAPQRPREAVARLDPLGRNGSIGGAQVLVNGQARGPFVLEVGMGRDPATWQPINQSSSSIDSSLLGIWRTAGLPAGDYTLRLRVTTLEGTATATQVVRYVP